MLAEKTQKSELEESWDSFLGAYNELPEDVTVLEVPVRRDPSTRFRVAISHPGDVVDMAIYESVEPGLVAGYSPTSNTLVVGRWQRAAD